MITKLQFPIKKRLFNFLGLVIIIAIAIISFHNLLLPKPPPFITVKLSGWTGNPLEQKLLKQVIQDFEKQHPQIKVKYEAIGGEIVDKNGYATFANDAGLQGLELVINQYQKDRSSAQKSDVGTNSGSEMFGQNKVAMVIEGNWAIPYLQETFPKLKFSTAEIPKINHKKATMVFTVAYVMNKQAPHKAQAWELISYLTGKEGMKKWTGTGFALPTRRSVAQQLGYDQDPLRSPLVAGIDYATPWQLGKYPTAIINNFDNQFISVLLGQQSLKQAMLKAQNAANQQIKADM